jgi:hypothetical protein
MRKEKFSQIPFFMPEMFQCKLALKILDKNSICAIYAYAEAFSGGRSLTLAQKLQRRRMAKASA